jgi:hypothetical protein
MTEYCESCNEELDSDEEEEGICKRCRRNLDDDEEYEMDEDFIDPGVT